MQIFCDTTRFIWEVLENQEYEFLFKDLVVIDLGCNIGTFSIWIYPLASKIYAVDKEEEHMANLRKTIATNDLKKITPVTARITGNDSEHTFSLTGLMSGHGIKESIDVLKMDIEGDELDIINALDFPADKINTIIGELHYSDSRKDEFITRLTALGYRYKEFPSEPSQAQHFVARK